MNSESSFSLQPVLEGPTLHLRPLLQDDCDALYTVASDPLIWAQHPSPLRYQRAVFQMWFEEALASCGALVAIDQRYGKVIGTSRYFEWKESQGEVAIGYTFLARSHWGGVINAELKRLMLHHAFQWAHTVWFHVVVQNVRSQKVMEKIGARISHRTAKQLTGDVQEYVFSRIERTDPWRFEASQSQRENAG